MRSSAPPEMPSSLLHRRRRRGHRLVGRGGRQQHEVDVGRRRPRPGRAPRCPGLDGEAGRRAADAPFADAGPLADPGVGGVEGGLEVGVGDDLLGQGGTPPGDRPAASGRGRLMTCAARRSAGSTMTRSPAIASTPATGRSNGDTDLLVADGAEHLAHAQLGARPEGGVRLEHPGGRADDHPLGGEQVLALDACRVASVGWSVSVVEQPIELVGRGHGVGAGAGDRPLGQAGQHRPGTDLDERGHAEVVERVEGLAPTHRAAQLGGEQARPLAAVGVRPARRRWRPRGSRRRGCRPRRAPCAGGRAPAP